MTQSEMNVLIQAMHRLEVTLIERLTRVEEKVKGQSELDDRLGCLETKCETDFQILRDRSNRLLLGLVVVAIIAGADATLRSIALF